ncbi:ubiquitin carboxyl-terminal hydrolase 32-like, partial [Ostrinia furnacalis]|uniref:ubiquitin carboxyl-terminal hydrolase 32-like n=1 Tax=Ostrinia furnacalis TaxID=93504 RepID=UPI0010401A57
TSNSTESMGSLLWRADTASVGSASSSGVSSAAAARPPPHPGPVDNKRLLAPNTLKVRTLTGEGGHLRRDVTLAQHRDFELVPDALWRALALWYGGPDPLPRQVIRPPNSDVELELYPLQLKILRHVPNTQRALSVVGTGGVAGGAYAGVAPAAPERTLAYTAAFSRLATVKQVSEFLCAALGLAREDVRLWALGANAVLLDDERPALHELRLDARRLLLELRNPDLTWPEEITALTGSRATERRETLIAPNLPGATGLHNLGNTCFMNAALQSVWNTGPLTQYFNSGMHMYELNTANPLGTKGALALRFGELCKEVWSCSARSVAPLRVRWVVSRHARALAGGGQHDAQELLAWLLDALHEDLNRAAPPPASPAPADSDGRPDQVSDVTRGLLAWLLDALHEDLNRAAPPPASPAPADSDGRPDQVSDVTRGLLAWLLDALHEDLNRAAPPPASPAPADSDGRPDQVVAAESWAAYTARNQSILTELFCGQLKSRVRCVTCSRDSVRFDSFNMLSLPLPMESIVRAEVRVILLDGSVPVKYGVRVHSEGTYLDLKQKLAKLCGLEPDSMLLVELSGATIGRVLEDGHKVCPARAMQLYAYELPPPLATPHHAPCVPGWSGAEAAWAEVSAPRGPASSLCMPALFCFKRSRSEILMSQSPPSAFYSRPDAADGPDATDGPDGPDATEEARGDPRSRTLPRELRRELDNGSPTLSVRSLTLKPGSPALGKARFGSSPSNMCGMDAPTGHVQVGRLQYLVAVHRKQCRMDAYFLSSQRCKPALFGVPLLVGLREGMSGRDIYAAVWTQVSRLLSARPPTHETSNHATDCDDSLGYEFPFTLRLVSGPLGAWCGACAWPALCRGCALPTHAAPLVLCCRECSRGRRPSAEAAQSSPAAAAKLQRHASARFAHQDESNDIAENGVIQRLEVSGARRRLLLAIDWDPTALHLRYQSTREKAWIEHPSVSECGAAAAAVDLASCLRAFTSDERLEQPYHCLACRSHQPASKALQLWRAPPVLIIHLKRFQYVNNKWIKSQKVVNFPFEDFDPTEFLASVPKETILRHRELTERRASLFMDVGDAITESEDSEDEDDKGEEAKDDSQPPKQKSKAQMAAKRRASLERGRRARLQSASLAVAPVADDDLQDFHAHRLQPGTDPFRLRYNLYAVVVSDVTPGSTRAACSPAPTPSACATTSTPWWPAVADYAPPLNDESNDIAENGVIQRLEVSGARRRLLLAIDWDPTALHLRYQSTREKAWIEHPSVSECGAAAAAVDLASCLRAFTSDERLEQPYHCLACRSHQPASKALQLWRAPPVLIIHLKRFQYVNNKWIKSQKVVNFPFEDFDPTEFLASVPKETILRHRELTERRASLFMDVGDAITESEDSEDEDDKGEEAKDDSQPPKQKSKAQMAAKRRASLERGRRARLQSASLAVAPVADDDLQDFHAHRLQPGTDPFRLRYNLYAVVSHSGQLSGGHYVAYARNPSGAWLCYNDSSCREVDPRRAIDPAAAYLLFYERQGLRYDKYLPEVVGPPPARAPPDADDPDMPRACALM